MKGMVKNILEEIEREAKKLSPEEQLLLIEKLVHKLKKEKYNKKRYYAWSKLYGLGKGLWEKEDAQGYINRLREDRV